MGTPTCPTCGGVHNLQKNSSFEWPHIDEYICIYIYIYEYVYIYTYIYMYSIYIWICILIYMNIYIWIYIYIYIWIYIYIYIQMNVCICIYIYMWIYIYITIYIIHYYTLLYFIKIVCSCNKWLKWISILMSEFRPSPRFSLYAHLHRSRLAGGWVASPGFGIFIP